MVPFYKIDFESQNFAIFDNFCSTEGWLLVLGIKEGLVECVTVCVKSVVILNYVHTSYLKDQKILIELIEKTNSKLLPSR